MKSINEMVMKIVFLYLGSFSSLQVQIIILQDLPM